MARESIILYSLIIPTRNRSEYVRRLLLYYVACGLRSPIFIADGSDEYHAAELIAISTELAGKLDIKYVAHGQEMSLFERLRQAARAIDTPFFAYVGDDDFLIPEALEKGSLLMSRRPDVSAVVGSAIVFTMYGQAAHGKIDGMSPYAQRARTESCALDRLTSHSQSYSTTFYALRRTECALIVLDWLDPPAWDDENYSFYFLELLDSLLTVLCGKVAHLECLMMIRQVHANMTSVATRHDESTSHILLNPKWPDYSQRFLKILRAAFDKFGLQMGASRSDPAALALWTFVSRNLQVLLQEELAKAGINTSAKSNGKKLKALLANQKVLERVARKSIRFIRERLSLIRSAEDRAHFNVVRKILEEYPLSNGIPS